MVKLASILSFLTLLLVDEGKINTPQTVTYEAEDGALKGVQVENTAHGYTGTGYVTSYADSVGALTVVVVVPSTTLYDLDITYEAPYSDRYTFVTLNGAPNGKIYFPISSTFTKTSGIPILLKEGKNTIALTGNWKGYFVDSISITPLVSLPPHQSVEKLMRPVTWIMNRKRSQSEGVQCGGGSAWDGWSGPRWCDEGLVCKEINPFYSECRWP